VPSGKKSKQARRQAVAAPPPVVSKGGVRRRQASPRVLAIAGGVVVLAIVGIVLAVTLGGGSKKIASDVPTVGSLTNGLPGAADVDAMYKGIPQKGLFLGSAFAPVQMVIYIDLQCPICQNFETTSLPTLVSKYVKTGKVRIETKPWAFIGPDSVRGQDAMFAAAKQNRAYNFASVLYDNQGTENTGWLDDSMVAQIAASVPGMQVHQLLNDRNAGDVKKQADAVAAAAQIQKVTGTPTIFVGKTGSKPTLVGAPGAAPTLSEVETAIGDALAS
jgi:protein-disulfide isomerase